MAKFCTLFKKKEDVERRLANGSLVIHSVRPRDKNTFKSACYEVFHLIYTKHADVVQNFYWCSICKRLFKWKLKQQGNWVMTRHLCYKKHLEEKKAAQKAARKAAIIAAKKGEGSSGSSDAEDSSGNGEKSEEETARERKIAKKIA